MKISLAILNFVIVVPIAAIAAYFQFIAMIILMNGFTESDASWGIWVYIAWALFVTLAAGAGSVLIFLLMIRKDRVNRYVASLLSIMLCATIGVILNLIGIVAGLVSAEIARTGF